MGTNLGDFMFLYIDLVITTTVAVLSMYAYSMVSTKSDDLLQLSQTIH